MKRLPVQDLGGRDLGRVAQRSKRGLCSRSHLGLILLEAIELVFKVSTVPRIAIHSHLQVLVHPLDVICTRG